jgi:hypothetical protein
MILANLSVHSPKLMHLNHSTKLKHVNDKDCDCTLCLCSQDAAHLVLVIPRTLPKALVLLQAYRRRQKAALQTKVCCCKLIEWSTVKECSTVKSSNMD